jgi:hypothetical protein
MVGNSLGDSSAKYSLNLRLLKIDRKYLMIRFLEVVNMIEKQAKTRIRIEEDKIN